jgi:predicted  nucleic acid-binding Zn-ribbon protein
MSNPKQPSPHSTRTQLEEKLREVDERLRSKMRARGFDPAQDENLALTGPLAKLYTERDNLRDELETLANREGSASETLSERGKEHDPTS